MGVRKGWARPSEGIHASSLHSLGGSGRKYDWKVYILEGSIGGRDSLSESASRSLRKGLG